MQNAIISHEPFFNVARGDGQRSGDLATANRTRFRQSRPLAREVYHHVQG